MENNSPIASAVVVDGNLNDSEPEDDFAPQVTSNNESRTRLLDRINMNTAIENTTERP
jgi:hypothetical protein